MGQSITIHGDVHPKLIWVFQPCRLPLKAAWLLVTLEKGCQASHLTPRPHVLKLRRGGKFHPKLFNVILLKHVDKSKGRNNLFSRGNKGKAKV